MRQRAKAVLPIGCRADTLNAFGEADRADVQVIRGQRFRLFDNAQPQIRRIDRQWLLVFSCHPEEQTPEQIAAHGPHTTWTVPGHSALGPWDIAAARPFTGDPHLFAAPLVQRRDGSWAFIGFHHREPEGIHAFEIRDPLPVVLRYGELRAAA